MAKTQTQLNEEELVKTVDTAAKEQAVEEAKPVPGQELPEDFVNPAKGEQGHLCLDPKGRYQPTWFCLNIHRTGDHIPERQFVQCGSKSWRVKTGEWVDVPPEIINVLACTIQEEVEMDLRTANPLLDEGVSRVVRRIPRFSTSMWPSA